MFVERRRRYKICYIDKYDSVHEKICQLQFCGSQFARQMPNWKFSSSVYLFLSWHSWNSKWVALKIFESRTRWVARRVKRRWKDRQGGELKKLYLQTTWVLGKLSLLAVWMLTWVPWNCAKCAPYILLHLFTDLMCAELLCKYIFCLHKYRNASL